MRAAIFEQYGGEIAITEVGDPDLPEGGVILRIDANGVCRSDWHGWVGHDPSIPLPHVPGHEMAGTVVAIDPSVEAFSEGDRVTVPFVLGCGSCETCASGNQQICPNQYQPGFSGWGAFAEYVALPYAAHNLVHLPEAMSATTAAGLGCRFATAFRAVVDQGEVGEGTRLAVWGAGGVGLSAVMIGAAVGAEVVAIDISSEALRLASQFGARNTVLVSADSDPTRTVRELLDGGADVSLDALGSTDTAINSIRSLRRGGRHVQVGLMIGDDVAPAIPMWRLHALEVEFYGSHGMQAWRYPAMLDMVADGRLDPDKLVTRTATLTEGVEHLRSMDTFPSQGFVVIDNFAR